MGMRASSICASTCTCHRRSCLQHCARQRSQLKLRSLTEPVVLVVVVIEVVSVVVIGMNIVARHRATVKKRKVEVVEDSTPSSVEASVESVVGEADSVLHHRNLL